MGLGLPAAGGPRRPAPHPDCRVPAVVLLELGRHAACVLLTGPASPNPPGLVSVTKQKVQDLVLGGRVVHLAEGGPESDQAVRDRLSRLRYRSEA